MMIAALKVLEVLPTSFMLMIPIVKVFLVALIVDVVGLETLIPPKPNCRNLIAISKCLRYVCK